jgi:hypothetical protein
MAEVSGRNLEFSMTTTLVRLSAAIEAATGVALIAVPGLVARVLLGAGLSGSGIAVARLTGIALLSLGLACRPGRDDVSGRALLALFTYNLLAAFYLGYLRVGGGFISYLLWPACTLHALLALLLAPPAYERVRKQSLAINRH